MDGSTGRYSNILEVKRTQTQFGGVGRTICGAGNRHGGICRRPPIKEGRGRCLMHCGPKAAKEYRERQRQEFLSGRISATEWKRHEERRATNRLRENWKKSPWKPGQTIDLGKWTADFERSLREHGIDPVALPPAVLDWARWKFRRYRLDRRDDAKWRRILREDLPDRVRSAGPCPSDLATSTDVGPGSGAISLTHPPDRSSKRVRPDQPKAVSKVRVRKQFHRGRPRKHVTMTEAEENELALFQVKHIATLRPLYEQCRSNRQRLNVIHALRSFVSNPNDRGAQEHWMAVLEALKPH